MNKKKSILTRLVSLLFTNEDVTRNDKSYVLFVLADGNEVYVDKKGLATLKGLQTMGGEYKLADGSILVIDEKGLFVETKAPSATKKRDREDVLPQTMHKHIRLTEFEPKTSEGLKAKIAAMQDIIDELATALDEANQMIDSTSKEANELNKCTLSSQSIKKKNIFHKPEYLRIAERMDVVLKQKINRR